MIITLYTELSSRDLGPERYSRLLSVYPEGDHKGGFTMKLPENDPRIKGILNCLAELGFQPKSDRFRRTDFTREFRLIRRRWYDESDFRTCELLELIPSDWIKARCINMAELGQPYALRSDAFKPSIDISKSPIIDIATNPYERPPVLIPDRVAQVLRAADLKGLELRTTLADLPSRMVEDGEVNDSEPWQSDPWWQVASTVETPPVSAFLTKRDGQGEYLPRTARYGSMFEADFDDRELHYLRSELNALGPFDIARLYESAGEGPFVVSKKFYDLFQQHGFKCDWRPVRIDEC